MGPRRLAGLRKLLFRPLENSGLAGSGQRKLCLQIVGYVNGGNRVIVVGL